MYSGLPAKIQPIINTPVTAHTAPRFVDASFQFIFMIQ
jgi:hypothetical protein